MAEHTILYKRVDGVLWRAYCTCGQWESAVGTRSSVQDQATAHLRDVGRR